MSVEIFSVEYDGPALETGRMDVRDLAPALLALGTLCDEANALLNGDKAKVSLQVRADFKRGSFDVHLNLIVSLLEQAKNFLLGTPKDAKDILELLGFYGTAAYGAIKGVTKLAKTVGKRKVRDVKALGDGTAELLVDTNETLIVDESTWRLYRKSTVAIALEHIVEPLHEEGVEEFRVVKDRQPVETIAKADLVAFEGIRENIDDPNLVNESTVDRVFEVITGSKTPGYIWRLSDGSDVITAHINDPNFFEKMERGDEIVSLGDLLHVRIRTVTTRDGTKLKTVNTVIKVLKHTPVRRSNDPPPMLNFG